MNSTLLKEKIVFEQPVFVSGEYGHQQKAVYSAYTQTYAYVQYVGGNKNIQNYEMFASQTLQFQIRYRQDINENMRVKYNNKYYNILNIKPLGWHDSIIITADISQQ